MGNEIIIVNPCCGGEVSVNHIQNEFGGTRPKCKSTFEIDVGHRFMGCVVIMPPKKESTTSKPKRLSQK
jgi:hypothetical protein